MGAQVAVVIGNARLYQQACRRADEMTLLQDDAGLLGATLNRRDALEALMRGVERLIPSEGGEVCLYDPDRQVFTTEATLGETAVIASAHTYTLDEGYTGWIGRTGSHC